MTAISVKLNNLLLELTPLQRWDAMTKPQDYPNSARWFAVIGLFLVVVLTGVLIGIYRRRKTYEKSSARLFDEYARTRDLTDREYQVLLTLATNAELLRPELIYNLPSVFDRQSLQLQERVRSEQGNEPSQQLQTELMQLRQKLGFRRQTVPPLNPVADTEGHSTLQMPAKKKMFIKARPHQTNFDLEAMVIKNTSAGLTVQLQTPVEIVFGQCWTCRYYAGAFVAEFDTTVVKCSGSFVLLAHSYQVRMINRRRYQRVPIHKQAYVAVFPFKKEPACEDRLPRKKVKSAADRFQQTRQPFELPRFMPATVTEIGGPGLKVNTGLPLKVGDRVLIIFKLDTTKPAVASVRHGQSEMVIEHIAKVRHITNNQSDHTVALELTGLHEEGIDELIDATNKASIRMKKSQPETEDSTVQTVPQADLVSV